MNSSTRIIFKFSFFKEFERILMDLESFHYPLKYKAQYEVYFRSTLKYSSPWQIHTIAAQAVLTALRRTRSVWQGKNIAVHSLQFISNEIRVISPAAVLAFQKQGLAWLFGPGPQAQPAPWWAGQSMWSAAHRSPAPLTAAPGPGEQERKQTEQWKSLMVQNQDLKWIAHTANCLPILM